MIKKINIIFLLIISFSFCTSVFAEKQREDDLIKTDDELIEECLENKNLLECEEILINFNDGVINYEGSTNKQSTSGLLNIKAMR